MVNTVYKINKSINKPIEFRGLKAQWIWWLAGGMIALLLVFAILYIFGINPFLCVGFVLSAGGFWFFHVYRLSNKYGEYGMMKKMARRACPKTIKSYSRKFFMKWKKT
jgi:hypothetical protein